MLRYPDIDPVAFTIGPVAVHWYGLMYLLGFGLAWWLGHLRAQRPGSGWSPNQVADLVFYGAVGAIIGGRLGYLLFYKPGAWLADPLMAVRLWEGGMSFHGGLIGAIVALWLLARVQERSFTAVTDFAAPLIPLGLGAGRIGNFINGELWGRPTELPWGMVFPHVDDLARHPSQLYQAAFEGVALFALLWWFTARPRPRMAASALFLLGYGVARFTVEFARAPDPGIGFVAFNWMTMGQVLSLPMAVAGIVLLAWAYRDSARPRAAGS